MYKIPVLYTHTHVCLYVWIADIQIDIHTYMYVYTHKHTKESKEKYIHTYLHWPQFYGSNRLFAILTVQFKHYISKYVVKGQRFTMRK